mgnify:CR=1 FL=1
MALQNNDSQLGQPVHCICNPTEIFEFGPAGHSCFTTHHFNIHTPPVWLSEWLFDSGGEGDG